MLTLLPRPYTEDDRRKHRKELVRGLLAIYRHRPPTTRALSDAVAVVTGVRPPVSTVLQWAKGGGYQVRKSKGGLVRKLTDADARMLAEFTERESQLEVATRFGLSLATVTEAIARARG